MTTPLPACPLCASPCLSVETGFRLEWLRCSNKHCQLNDLRLSAEQWLKLCRAEPPKPPEPELMPCPICGHLPRVGKGIVACGSSICPMHIHWFEESTWSEFPRQHIGGPTIPTKLAEALKEWRQQWHAPTHFAASYALSDAIDAEPLLKPKP